MSEDSIAEDPSEFWNKRHELSPHPIQKADVQDRESGRHLVFLVDITDGVMSQLESETTALDEFNCLDAWPLEYLHITVKVIGTIGTQESELVPADEQRFIDAGHSVFDNISSFTVTFPKLNLFPSVVYAEVADDSRFTALNDRICDISGVPVYDRDGDGFIPHMALARFTQEEGYKSVIEYLERARYLETDPVEISTIQLCAFDYNKWYPSFEIIETYDLH
jgi:2'-5' RNA ligase